MPRLASLLLALALACVLPSTADARDLIRGAFGHGTLVTAGAPCTTPGANPSNRRADCPGIEATAFDTCVRNGFDQLCDIRVTAQAPAGWRFARWSELSDRCATSTIATCTIRSQEVNCDDDGENCVTNEPGPFVVVAEFVDTRAPTITNIAGPAQLDIAFDDARQQTFGFTTNEDDEAPKFRCALDAGPLANCENPHRLNGLVDGIHRLCVTAADASGLPSVPLCRTWQQETIPTVVLGNRPPAATTATDAAFTYTSNKVGHERDNSSLTFECRLDAAVFAACPADGTRFAGLGDGTHEFSVRAVFRGAFEPAGARHTSPGHAPLDGRHDAPGHDDQSGPLDGSGDAQGRRWRRLPRRARLRRRQRRYAPGNAGGAG